MLYRAQGGVDTPAEDTVPVLVGHVPVLGQGLHPLPAREEPGLGDRQLTQQLTTTANVN